MTGAVDLFIPVLHAQQRLDLLGAATQLQQLDHKLPALGRYRVILRLSQ